jgi:hypothetical protein
MDNTTEIYIKALLDIHWYLLNVTIIAAGFEGDPPEDMRGFILTKEGGTRNRWGDGHNVATIAIIHDIMHTICDAVDPVTLARDEFNRQHGD